jgi:hypothetical protein
MFPYVDSRSRLELHHQRVHEMIERAAEHRLAREVSRGRHRRTGRWPRWRRQEAPAARATVPA